MTQYVIRILDSGTHRYLFSTRMLLDDIALAKHFSSTSLAKRYLKKSEFSTWEHQIVPVLQYEPTIDRRTMSAIVE